MCRAKAQGGRRCATRTTTTPDTTTSPAPGAAFGATTNPTSGPGPAPASDPDTPQTAGPPVVQPGTGQSIGGQDWPPLSGRTEMFGKPLTEAERRSLGLREAGYQGWINKDGHAADAAGVQLTQAETAEWIATGRRGDWNTRAASVTAPATPTGPGASAGSAGGTSPAAGSPAGTAGDRYETAVREYDAATVAVNGSRTGYDRTALVLGPLSRQAKAEHPDAYADHVAEGRALLRANLIEHGDTPAQAEAKVARLEATWRAWRDLPDPDEP